MVTIRAVVWSLRGGSGAKKVDVTDKRFGRRKSIHRVTHESWLRGESWYGRGSGIICILVVGDEAEFPGMGGSRLLGS